MLLHSIIDWETIEAGREGGGREGGKGKEEVREGGGRDGKKAGKGEGRKKEKKCVHQGDTSMAACCQFRRGIIWTETQRSHIIPSHAPFHVSLHTIQVACVQYSYGKFCAEVVSNNFLINYSTSIVYN